jgi:hypothetical protein
MNAQPRRDTTFDLMQYSLHFEHFETRPPFCAVVHFVYILMDPDPTLIACHQNIRLATNMKFAGVNIYGHPNI